MDKLKSILELQENGLTLKEIAEQLNYSSVKVLQNFLRRRGYKNINGIYIEDRATESKTAEVTTNNTTEVPKEPTEEEIKEVHDTIDRIKVKMEQHKERVEEQREERVKLVEDKVNGLEAELQGIKAMLEGSSSNSSSCSNKESSSSSKSVKVFNTNEYNLVARSYKVEEQVQEEFKKFCRVNSEYKVSDLITNALMEYMENFNK